MTRPDQRDREIEALQERLSRLSEASLRINESLDFDTVLQGVLDSACSLTGAHYGVLTLLDELGQVQNFLSSGMTGARRPNRSGSYPSRWQLFEYLSRLSEPLRIPDLWWTRPGHMGLAEFRPPLPVGPSRPISGVAGVPPGRAGGQHLSGRPGRRRRVHPYADEETLVMFASQAALVIANARTYRDEQRARNDLEALVNTSPVGVAVLNAQTGAPESLNREAMRIVAELE